MPDFPIDPELRIRASPPIVLRRTTEAVDFIRKVALSTPDRAWQDLLQSFEAARDEWSAMEAVVHLELVLEAGGLLIEEATAYAARSARLLRVQSPVGFPDRIVHADRRKNPRRHLAACTLRPRRRGRRMNRRAGSDEPCWRCAKRHRGGGRCPPLRALDGTSPARHSGGVAAMFRSSSGL